jgi:hypothetical protein
LEPGTFVTVVEQTRGERRLRDHTVQPGRRERSEIDEQLPPAAWWLALSFMVCARTRR